ncbi:uncharacterized protein THITE_2107084 [Thermothielavioides terrestris NRRL 8126]|uniref:Uncharacterized protein n=1 Tax=Thermothielavioides terrestris (strain ATCC 38088 / NRRL 8126) TaxID=578455 RepID=G2QSS9_THETT|nr:uncharacterized protein THITE_2107084 [Thermothielavioides terrestris NRRL 8126]AEO62654.1 hypothetical protein THITE_2107084 [Thermothielavioides terrestris NRRL 8126]
MGVKRYVIHGMLRPPGDRMKLLCGCWSSQTERKASEDGDLAGHTGHGVTSKMLELGLVT